MVGLGGEVGGAVVVDAVDLEGVVADVAPEDGDHAVVVCLCEHVGDILDLLVGFIGAEVDCCADGGRAHLPALLDGAEGDLVEGVGVGHEFVVVELDEVGDLVGVLACGRAEHAEGRGDGVAAALDGELDDVLGVEVVGVGREGGAGGVLDALIDGEDRGVAGAGEAAVVQDAVEVVERVLVAIAHGHNAVDEVPAGEVESVFGDGGLVEAEQRVVFEDLGDIDGEVGHGVFPAEIV